MEEGPPNPKVDTQTHRSGLAPLANTQTLPGQGERMGGRVTITRGTVTEMTTGTQVMELERGEEETEEVLGKQEEE